MMERNKRVKNVEYLNVIWIVFLGTCFIIPNIPALEVVEQCSLNHGSNQKLATVQGTISYQLRMVNVPPDFWKEGVSTSKRIINKILQRINSFENDMNRNQDDEIEAKIWERFKKISGDDIWFDEKKQKPVDREAFCASVGEMKAKERKVLKYTCTESEQLYGIGYHKLYEDCKDEAFLSKFSVDWSICLHAHYPWVDMTQWSICVIKSFKNDFLACFCMEEDGKIKKRSFCITKFECFLHGQGIGNQVTALVVRDSCKNSIQFFMEVNVKTKKAFKKVQEMDKLRVRALYHPESPCKDYQFSAQFDVGQLDTENLISGIEVHTPKLIDYKMIPDEPREPMQCGIPKKEEQRDPVVRQQHQMLDDIFKERMATSAIIWIPGIFFLYSLLSSEKSTLQILFIWIVQSKVITLGLYNVVMAPTLWSSNLFSKGDIGNTEITVLFISFFITITWLNRREVAERFLCYSIVYSIVTLFISNLTAQMMTRESLNLIEFLAHVFYTSFAMFICYHISHLVRSLKREESYKKENKNVPMRKKDQFKKKNVRKKKKEQNNNNTQVSTKFSQLLSSEHKDEKVIVCNWDCNISDNTEYVTLHCSNKCVFVYHKECWGLFLGVEEVREELYLLEYPCSQINCMGTYSEILWFNKFGKKTSCLKKNYIKDYVEPKIKKCVKLLEENDQHCTTLSDDGFMDNSQSEQDMHRFESYEKIDESGLGITTSLLTAMDFEKLYEIGRNEPFQLNDELENEYLSASHFGIIGGERKKKPIQSEDSFDDMLDDQDVFQGLLADKNIKFSDDQSSPKQSKFLNMINRNNSKETERENLEAEFFNGISFNLESLNSASPTLTYLHNLEARTKTKKNDDQLETNSLAYISGTPGSWMMEEEFSQGVELVGIEEEDLEEKVNPQKENYNEKIKILPTGCPLTQMIQKHAPKYDVKLVEAAVKTLMIEVDLTATTIPYFQELVIKKLDEDNGTIYISDDDEEEEEVEECLICTELLDKDLQSLEPCKHIFHLVCIKQWLGKDTSCPKCRAIVIQIE